MTNRENLVQGKPRSRVPYGYRIIRDPETRRSVGRTPDPLRASHVQEAARRVLAGHSQRAVVAWMKN